MNAIGSDESLKGDTFGGIVVAGVYVEKAQEQALLDLGIRDSKKISDKKVRLLAKQIKDICPHAICSIYPKEYNQKSLTPLLNALHAQVYETICKQIGYQPLHIVDKFPGCTVGTIQEFRAESLFISVGAASILAREQALVQLEELSKRAGFLLPKGSTHVQDALKQLKEKKLVANEFVKMHFKNVQQALRTDSENH
ncbi:MAG: ribonuclease HIII [Candidatus Woesearchaeota archaeon]